MNTAPNAMIGREFCLWHAMTADEVIKHSIPTPRKAWTRARPQPAAGV